MCCGVQCVDHSFLTDALKLTADIVTFKISSAEMRYYIYHQSYQALQASHDRKYGICNSSHYRYNSSSNYMHAVDLTQDFWNHTYSLAVNLCMDYNEWVWCYPACEKIQTFNFRLLWGFGRKCRIYRKKKQCLLKKCLQYCNSQTLALYVAQLQGGSGLY